jgi:cytoskeletal protein RodZ
MTENATPEPVEVEETTLTNIRALREDLVSLHASRSNDGAKRHRLVILVLGLVSGLLIASVLMVSQMMVGVSSIQEDQQVVHDDIARVLIVTTHLAESREARRAPPPAPAAPRSP